MSLPTVTTNSFGNQNWNVKTGRRFEHNRSKSEDESLINKRLRNAEAAKRCREKKKEKEKEKYQEMEGKLMQLSSRSEEMENQNAFLHRENGKLRTKETLLTNLVSKLKIELGRQKDHIIKLEQNLMATRRVAPTATLLPEAGVVTSGFQQNLGGISSHLIGNMSNMSLDGLPNMDSTMLQTHPQFPSQGVMGFQPMMRGFPINTTPLPAILEENDITSQQFRSMMMEVDDEEHLFQ